MWRTPGRAGSVPTASATASWTTRRSTCGSISRRSSCRHEFTFGDSGRGILRGDHQWNVDFSLFKRFGVTGGTTLEFRAEAFNLLNSGVLQQSQFQHRYGHGRPGDEHIACRETVAVRLEVSVLERGKRQRARGNDRVAPYPSPLVASRSIRRHPEFLSDLSEKETENPRGWACLTARGARGSRRRRVAHRRSHRRRKRQGPGDRSAAGGGRSTLDGRACCRNIEMGENFFPSNAV